jgi:hypothetical protein
MLELRVAKFPFCAATCIICLDNAEKTCDYPVKSKWGTSLANDPIDRIIASWPIGFFQQLHEEMDAAFAQALRTATERVAAPERRNALGHLRHFGAEAGFRNAGQAVGLNVHVPDTVPKGSLYSLIEAKGIFLLRSNIVSGLALLRPSKFRRTWASLNAWLRPEQIDLFETRVPPASPDRLCGLLITTASNKLNPGLPAWVGIGIPTPDLSAWIKTISISDIIARFHDAGTAAPVAEPVEIKDRAMPKLKRKDGNERG